MTSTESVDVTSLPPEILSHIFAFLNYESLQSARLVSTSWYAASLDPLLVDREHVVLCSDDSTEQLEGIAACTRAFYHLKIKNPVSVDDIPQEFWQKSGHKWHSIVILRNRVFEDTLTSILRLCSNLKHLTLSYCTSSGYIMDTVEDTKSPDYKEDLSGLRVLQIISEDGIMDLTFRNIVERLPKLKLVDLECGVSNMDGFIQGILDYARDFFHRNPQVELRFSALRMLVCIMDDFPAEFEHSLAQLLLLPNVYIRKYTTNYFPKAISTINQPRMDGLILNQAATAYRQTEDAWYAINSKLPNLKTLHILGGWKVPPALKLRLPTKLTYIMIDFKETDVTEKQLISGLCYETNVTLKDATFMCDDNITAAFYINFVETHPALEKLTLGLCNVNDEVVQAILKHLVQLRSLNLRYNQNITDAGFTGEGFQNGYSLSRLEDLQFLGLKGCSNICGALFEKGPISPNLRHVDVEESNVTEKSLKCLVESNRSIVELEVDGLGISDDLVYAAVENLPFLEDIHIYRCENISQEAKDFLRSKGFF